MIDINFTFSYFAVYIIGVSLIAFILYSYDKLLAIRNSISRVSENKLLLTALIGGTIGALLSMFIFRHKIKKTSFMIKFSLVGIIQVAAIVLHIRGIL